MRLPLENESKRSDNKGGNEVSVCGKSVVIHAMIKSSLGDYDQSSISKLQKDDIKIWL